MKHLIVTGDDFGRSHEINEAIERSHASGFLTQASLMVNEPGAEEAVRIARRHPALGVGLHLTLCDGRASAVSAITNDAGEFCGSPTRAGIRYAVRSSLSRLPFCSSLVRPLEEEIRAQFDRFRALGLPPTYWDGHTHLHLHPGLHRLIVPVAVDHGFRAVRLVREPGPRSPLSRIFDALSRSAIPSLQQHAITFADHTFGLRDTGRITTATALRILQSLPDGVSEFYFHPGAEPEEIDSARLRAVLDERGVTRRTALPPPDAH